MLNYLFPSLFPLEDPILIFAIVLILFLFSPIVMAKFKLPGMIGLLISGAVLGPHALGLLERDSSFILLGAVGLIYIMFTAALEIDLSVFKKYGLEGIAFGLLTFSLPMGLGLVVALYVLQFNMLAAILLASMFASHTLLAYPIVSKLGLSSNRAVIASVAGTIVTDVLALLVLAVCASASQGDLNEAMWWKLGVSITIFVAGIFYALPKLGRNFFIKFPNDETAQFVFVLSSVFMCAALSHFAGLEPIVGAFLSGLALNRLIPHNGLLMNRLNFTGEAIFVPFFLLSVGMILDPKVLFGSVWTWVVAIAMTVTVIATKWMASRVMGFTFRYSENEKRVVFGLSIPQAAATLAAAIVGFRLEIFDESVVNGTIVMMLITCVIGPYFVSQNVHGLQVLEDSGEDVIYNFDKILLPVVSSEHFESNVELALLIKDNRSKTPLFPAYFLTEDKGDIEVQTQEAKKILAHSTSKINSIGIKVHPIKRVDTSVGSALTHTFKEIGAHLAIFPWDFQTSKNSSTFGSLIDDALKLSNARYLFTKLSRPITSSLQANVLFPALVNAEDVNEISKLIIRLASKLGFKVNLICHEGNKKDIEFIFNNLGSKLNKTYVTYPSDSIWLSEFDKINKPTDMIIITGRMQDRDTSGSHGLTAYNVSASSNTRDMVFTIAQKYPDQNLIFAI